MARTIPYVPKITGAKTNYREISQEDHDWLINQMIKATIKMATLSNTINEDQKQVRDQWYRKRRSSLPRGRDGQNTPESMIAGILDNMLYGETPQRDFSDKQMDAIEDLFKWLDAIFPNEFEEPVFRIGM
jgi:CRISPR/Cas system CSM-associated protein Csm2 small subunit